MTRTASRFDWIAPVYDALGTIMFGSNLRDAQEACLESILPESKILILGGGTGSFLPSLLAMNPRCQVWYIDLSAGMLRQAKQRVPAATGIQFLQGSENTLPADLKFDAVITFFYLDLFPTSTLHRVVERINRSLRDDARWLVADFIDTGSPGRKILLRLMYLFFRWTCGIEALRLPDWPLALAQSGWLRAEAKFLSSGFIVSSVYRRKAIG